jgi:hypothetical protein
MLTVSYQKQEYSWREKGVRLSKLEEADYVMQRQKCV